MEVSLCAKSHSFPLITFHSLSSSSSVSFLHLRPHGIRFSKTNNVRILKSPKQHKLLVKASLDANSVVLLVSFVSVSALSVVFFDNMKRKHNAKQPKHRIVSLRITSGKGKSTANGVEVLTKNFVDIADPMTVERKIHLPYYKEGSTYKSKGFRELRGFPNEKKKIVLTQNSGEDSQPSITAGVPATGSPSIEKHLPSRGINPYDKLLRAGRLVDCVELLQDIEAKGLLDMDKVYQARFLITCQSKRL